MGQRLRDFNLTFSSFLASSSIRAQETAKIIHEYFPKLQLETSLLLKEGKPVFPQPPIETWDPDDEVCTESTMRGKYTTVAGGYAMR